MADTRKIVKVFLASPGDLDEERKAVKLVADEINSVVADNLGYQIDLRGWEDTISGYGRPQEIINRELEPCEFFLGLMWKRWGSPSSISGPYTSGFEEEFNLSVRRREDTGRPQISIFFKQIDTDLLRDPGESLKKVLDFKQELIEEKKIFFENFLDGSDLQNKIRRCLIQYLFKLYSHEQASTKEKEQAPSGDDTGNEIALFDASHSENPLSVEGANFLMQFVKQKGAFSSEAIARTRLLAAIVATHSNDQIVLGVHDANLIYANRGNLNLSQMEVTGLITSGLAHYGEQIVPLWHWLYLGRAAETLGITSLISGPPDVQRNALDALRLISAPIKIGNISRENVVRAWLAENVSSDKKNSALTYLSDCGQSEDVPIVLQEFKKGDYKTASSALVAILRISLRDSREKAVQVLNDLQPSLVSLGVLHEIFNGAILPVSLLESCLLHTAPDVRKIAAQHLVDSNQLSVALADKLLIDSDPDVRYIAIGYLCEYGRPFSDDDAKSILVKKASQPGLGLLGSVRAEGEDNWRAYKTKRLFSLPIKALEAIYEKEGLIVNEAYFVLVERRFSSMSKELRGNFDDSFQGKWNQEIQKIAKSFPQVVEKFNAVADVIREECMTKAFRVFCKKRQKADLQRVRKALKEEVVTCSLEALDYLGAYGEWEDITLILDAIRKNSKNRRGSTVLSGGAPDAELSTRATKVIYALGRDRLSELMKIDGIDVVLARLLNAMTDSIYKKLEDDSILPLFRSKNEEVRKFAILKSIKSYSKSRLLALLSAYELEETRYYNVIHWLDFGISAPREDVIQGANKALKGAN